MSVLTFLRAARNKDICKVQYISLGNTAGDLDSIVSSIADAWISSTPDKVWCPVLNFPRSEFDLRIQQKSWLRDVIGAGSDDFWFYDDFEHEKVANLCGSFIKDIHLVDHHVLPPEQIHLSPKVSSILDHHQPVGTWPDGVETHIVVPLGSCASLLALRMPSDAPMGLWRLLWGAILIDTVNFDESIRDKRWTQMDLEAAAAVPAEAKRDNDFKYLADLKFDLDAHLKLSTRDLFRLDYKEYVYPRAKIGYASIPIAVVLVASRETFLADCEKYAKERNLDGIVINASYFAEGALRREFATWSPDHLHAFAALSPTLELELLGEQQSFRMFKQGDPTVSRKAIEPLIAATFSSQDEL